MLLNFFLSRWTNCEAIVNEVGMRNTKKDTKVKHVLKKSFITSDILRGRKEQKPLVLLDF